MALTEDEKAAMRAATYEAASALVEDLDYMRMALAKSRPTSGDVRRLSVTLRRLLLDGHLAAVAAPRIGRTTFDIPDHRDHLANGGGDFMSVGFAPIFGWDHGLFEHFRVTENSTEKQGENSLQLAATISFPLRSVNSDGLLSDRIIRFRGDTVSRGDALKFICYHAYGVHYTGKGEESAADAAIRQVRNLLTFENGESPVLGVRVSDRFGCAKPANTLMDLAHAHTLSTGHYLATAPAVIRLQTLIEAEIADHESAAQDRPD